MNKLQLVDAICLETGLSKVAVRKSVDAMIRVIVRSLKEEERITLSGLGSFSVMHKPARIGRNPRSGAAVKIAPKRVVKFRPTADLDS